MADEIKPTILVVEDDFLIRMHEADILEQAGFRVLEAGNADEALEILSQYARVQLLFSDIDMPGSMDGLELAAQVHKRWPNIRLLMTSGKHLLEEADLPDDGQFVSKPWSEEALVAKIKLVLG